VDGADDPDDDRPSCPVLEGYTDEDENQETDTYDVGHDPVSLQGGVLGRVHEGFNVASPRPSR
jgi:hypothetical protein